MRIRRGPSHGSYDYGPHGSGINAHRSCFPSHCDLLPPMKHVMFGGFSNPFPKQWLNTSTLFNLLSPVLCHLLTLYLTSE